MFQGQRVQSCRRTYNFEFGNVVEIYIHALNIWQSACKVPSCNVIGTIESVNNIFTTYLESFVHFYDLNNHYLNKTLLSVGGTMSQMMK